MRKISKSAFTLAEVLITLSIIGVIASMVIPSLVQDIQDAQHTSALKKMYSDLTQATMLIQTTNISIPLTNDPSGVRDAFGKVMQFIKVDSAQNIWGQVGAGNTSSKYKNYKGTAPAYMHLYTYNPAAIMSNGTFIGFVSGYRESNGFHEIYVDTNGSKGPNMQGLDVHKFALVYSQKHYKLLPMGAPGTQWTGNCSAGSNTWSTSWPCTALRLKDPDHMP